MPHIYQQVLRTKRSIHPLISNHNSKKNMKKLIVILLNTAFSVAASAPASRMVTAIQLEPIDYAGVTSAN